MDGRFEGKRQTIAISNRANSLGPKTERGVLVLVDYHVSRSIFWQIGQYRALEKSLYEKWYPSL
jgi:hypothetical protein